MSQPGERPRRVLAEAIRDLPGGLVARPTGPEDVAPITALMRAADIAGCGHTSTNLEEVTDELADPDCDWAHGSAVVCRGPEVVGALLVFDGLASGRGWMLDVYAKPGDPRAHGIEGALIDAALREGRTRFDLLYPDPDEPMQDAKSGCYANDGGLRAELEQRGMTEVRRFWRMRLDHWSGATLTPVAAEPDATGPAGNPVGGRAGAAGDPTDQGYRIRPFRDVEADWRALHEVMSSAFLDHFDFTPIDYDEWRGHTGGQTEDPAQWIVAESDGVMVGYARGSNRYAADDCGYVASIGVLSEHRGRGIARALLQARLADDIARGFISTLLHVDATNPTGATRLYESVGMVVDSEFVGFRRPLYG
jgi:ribosomal protein S18 acetylase RimI-like enzyme